MKYKVYVTQQTWTSGYVILEGDEEMDIWDQIDRDDKWIDNIYWEGLEEDWDPEIEKIELIENE